MKRWRRRAAVGAAVLAAALLLRAGCGLLPPRLLRAPAPAALYGVTVINPGGDRRADQIVTLRAGRIDAIVADDGRPRLPRDRIHAGFYALPGLIDAQVRRLPAGAQARRLLGVYFLAAGVTTVRVVGSLPDDAPALRAALAADAAPWPRLVACGRMLTGPAPSCRLGEAVADAAGASAAVERLAAAGADCLAVHHDLAATTLPALRAAAAARGLPLIGDLPPGAAVDAAGFTDLSLLSLAPPAPAARTAADWLRGWPADALDAWPAALATRPTTVTTSLVRWGWPLADAAQREQALFVALLPPLERLAWEREERALAALSPADLHAALAALHGAVRALHAAGVPLALGSGTPSPYVAPGGGLRGELLGLAASVGAEAAWSAATRSAGAALGVPQLGTLAPGAPADLLLFRRDPSQDLAAFDSLEAVMVGGRLYPTRRLIGDTLEVARYTQRPPYAFLSTRYARLLEWWHGGEQPCAPL